MISRKIRLYFQSIFAGIVIACIALFFAIVYIILSVISGFFGLLALSDIDIFPDLLNAPTDIYGGQ